MSPTYIQYTEAVVPLPMNISIHEISIQEKGAKAIVALASAHPLPIYIYIYICIYERFAKKRRGYRTKAVMSLTMHISIHPRDIDHVEIERLLLRQIGRGGGAFQRAEHVASTNAVKLGLWRFGNTWVGGLVCLSCHSSRDKPRHLFVAGGGVRGGGSLEEGALGRGSSSAVLLFASS